MKQSSGKAKVWVSRVMVDSSLIKGFDSDVTLADRATAVDAMERNTLGEPLPAERFPSEMYGKYPDKKHKRLPDICLANSFWVVTRACADVLRDHDLGDGGLYPVKIFQHNRSTPVEGEYFCVNFGAQKHAFLPDQSPGVRKSYPNAKTWMLEANAEDDLIALSTASLEGPDLWVDPLLWMGLFLSDRLASALRAAKLTRRFGLRRCRLISVT